MRKTASLMKTQRLWPPPPPRWHIGTLTSVHMPLAAKAHCPQQTRIQTLMDHPAEDPPLYGRDAPTKQPPRQENTSRRFTKQTGGTHMTRQRPECRKEQGPSMARPRAPCLLPTWPRRRCKHTTMATTSDGRPCRRGQATGPTESATLYRQRPTPHMTVRGRER